MYIALALRFLALQDRLARNYRKRTKQLIEYLNTMGSVIDKLRR